jgi:histidinol-phosphate aminotransferase|tara:strand:- start:35168 stop:36253 length:1086 start_codon:yes stop_codon:yes gene_type:complete
MAISPKQGLASIDYYMVGISKLPGWDEPIKLSSNESVLGMSPMAIEAAQRAIQSSHLYPEVDTETLAEALAERYQLKPECMAFGPGSDEVLQRLVNTFSGPGEELVYSKNAYMQFPIYAKVAGATPVAADDSDFHYDVDKILSKLSDKTRIVLLANPDNPSGTCLSGTEMRRLHAGLSDNVLLIIDSAYEEFASQDDFESGTNLVHEFDNVVVTRSFSKVYGLAGLRLGWCYGPDWLVDVITKIGPSFPANTASYAAGIAAVEDTGHVDKVLRHNRKWIDELTRNFARLGLKVYPSQTNFVLVEFPVKLGKTAAEVNSCLNDNGIIPRQFAVKDFNNKLRFTVGKDDGMEKTIKVMQKLLG